MTKSLSRRWILNSLTVVVALLLFFLISFSLIIRSTIYQQVELSLYTRAKSLADLLNSYVTDFSIDFETGGREFVEQFREKERMELQILDKKGRTMFSSTGFTPVEEAKPDFQKLRGGNDEDQQDYGSFRGRSAQGENIAAVSVLVLDHSNAVCGGVRCVVSLTLVDNQIMMLIVAMLLVCAVILLVVIFLSTYFVQSILTPLREVGNAARRMALGDYDYRITKTSQDEIGELCDTINYMAGEISASEKLKNEFISSVSHELRTPLTAIKGWGETLCHGGAADQELLEKGLDVISGEAERLTSIVEELLDFSRMQSGQMSMKFDRMDLLAELEEAVFLFRDRAKREGIDLVYVETDSLPPVWGDHDRLKQVFINILDNAIKYSHFGGTVRVEAVHMDRHIQVVISDTGKGISAEDLPKVKNKFYRVNNSLPGSGIGLALADDIVRLHKGQLEIDSELGKGTTVTVTLPVYFP